MAKPRRYSQLTNEQKRIYRRLQRDTVIQLGLQSASELTDDERHIIINLAIARRREARGSRRDVSWNGPLARWLDLTGRRPMRQGVEVGDTPTA